MTAGTPSQTGLGVWRRLMRAQGAITHVLDSELRAAHGITLTAFIVLMRLRAADDHRLRMSDLADDVVLTRSGMTRLVDGLVRDGLVERVSCSTDARVSYAMITEQGLERIAAARADHVATIDRAFSSHFTPDELAQFSELIDKLPAAEHGMGGCCDTADS